ncbi:SsrA-binding protein [Tenacibaculum sp. SG-28]|nr:SsrA-binding protein [Tenacibaculum sp. SG-28]PQJ22884.1 SsrA-binding protein [Tenacibaculum sp. SG-28]
MKIYIFKFISILNKVILPSYTKKKLDISKASKFQLAIIGWKAFTTINSIK